MATQILNSPDVCVDEALKGIVAVNPALKLFPEKRLVVDGEVLRRRSQGEKPKVVIVTGGGSGHEPFSAGYVGTGMLGAAVAGSIFASPAPDLITSAISVVGQGNNAGVLVIVFNYTGDRINFGIAVERAKAAGIKVEMHISGDDCALTSTEGTAGRRGLCGTFFIIKIAGSMAEKGASLEDILSSCRAISQACGTLGVALSGCTLPGSSTQLFTLEPGMMELGLGVHGERGAKNIEARSAKMIVSTILNHMTKPESATRLELKDGDHVAVIINNLGGITQLEMFIITMEVTTQLKQRGVTSDRIFMGNIMTSLEMRGFHISILRLDDSSWLNHLDAPTDVQYWPKPYLPLDSTPLTLNVPLDLPKNQQESRVTISQAKAALIKSCLKSVTETLPKYEDSINVLDTGCGDGDCGTTLAHGSKGLAKQLGFLPYTQPVELLTQLSDLASSSMGGTLGGVYSVLLMSAATYFASQKQSTAEDRQLWTSAFRAGLNAVMKYGGANTDDRTLLDAACPALEVLEAAGQEASPDEILTSMAKAADEGAKRTKDMIARAGRASYVKGGNVMTEDAGARAFVYILEALAKGAKTEH